MGVWDEAALRRLLDGTGEDSYDSFLAGGRALRARGTGAELRGRVRKALADTAGRSPPWELAERISQSLEDAAALLEQLVRHDASASGDATLSLALTRDDLDSVAAGLAAARLAGGLEEDAQLCLDSLLAQLVPAERKLDEMARSHLERLRRLLASSRSLEEHPEPTARLRALYRPGEDAWWLDLVDPGLLEGRRSQQAFRDVLAVREEALPPPGPGPSGFRPAVVGYTAGLLPVGVSRALAGLFPAAPRPAVLHAATAGTLRELRFEGGLQVLLCRDAGDGNLRAAIEDPGGTLAGNDEIELVWFPPDEGEEPRIATAERGRDDGVLQCSLPEDALAAAAFLLRRGATVWTEAP